MGLIYWIRCRIEMDDVYVGSSEDERTYEKRQINHKSKQNECSSKIIIDRGDYYFQIIEENDLQKVELRKREQFWIEKCNAINKQRAYTSEEERKEYMKEYNEKNKEKQKEYFKEYYETNKEAIREYNEKHKEEQKEYDKLRYEKHKEKLKSGVKARFDYKCSMGGLSDIKMDIFH